MKGDIARSMFYIYTIYRELVAPEDPNYFPLQVATLCQWHLADPVDERSGNRS
ncbi:MAG: endonuclease [Saprospiraceae bacterium]|nr:endonuclease [Saprospiraceae bacterium]